MHWKLKFVVLLVCSLGCRAEFDKVSLQNNAYNGVVVAIGSEVPEDTQIVEDIKETITEASKILFSLTKNRAYFGDVTILIPNAWNGNYKIASGQLYDMADVIVADANPVYGDSPYTLQYGQCGEPGTYIHLPPEYLKEYSKDRGKRFVEEWARLRWGLDEKSLTDVDGDWRFLDIQANDVNRVCGLQSYWDVLERAVDFHNTNPPNPDIEDLTPKFAVVQERRHQKIVIVVDVSINENQLRDVKRATSILLDRFLSDGTKVGIVTSTSSVFSQLTSIDDSRQHLVEIVSNAKVESGSCIGCGILDGLEVLRGDGEPVNGGRLIILSCNKDTESRMLPEVKNRVMQLGVIVDFIMSGGSATTQELENLSEQTGGLPFYNNPADRSQFVASLAQLVNSYDGDAYDNVLQIYSKTFEAESTQFNDEVLIDSGVGRDTIFSFTYLSKPMDVIVISPEGSRFCTKNIRNCEHYAVEDSLLEMITFTIPGTATAGTWFYHLSIDVEVPSIVDIIVTSKMADRQVKAITANAEVSTYQLETKNSVVIYTKVATGYIPVLGASVLATVIYPSGQTKEVELHDDGSEFDVSEHDGIYSRGFSDLKETGKYFVQVKVLRNGLKNSAKIDGDAKTAIGKITTSQLDLFTRVAWSSFFINSRDLLGEAASIPLTEVDGLQAEQVDVTDLSRGVRLTFSIPGSKFNRVSDGNYEVRYSYVGEKQLLNNFEGCSLVKDYSYEDNSIIVKLENFPQYQEVVRVWFAIRLLDKTSTRSSTSNVASISLFSMVEDMSGSGDEPTATPKSEVQKKLEIFQLVTIILSAVCLVLICSLVATIVLHKRLDKQRDKLLKKPKEEVEMDSVLDEESLTNIPKPAPDYQMFKRPEIKPQRASYNNYSYNYTGNEN